MREKQKLCAEELAAQLEGWNAQVALYQAKAESATAEARIDYFEIVAALQRMQDEVRNKLPELKPSNA